MTVGPHMGKSIARTLFAAAALLASSCLASDAPDDTSDATRSSDAQADDAAAPIVVYGYKVVNAYPHDEDAFTQGLFYRDGYLSESTGQYGASSVRQVDLASGAVLMKRMIDDQYFGEGAVDWNDTVVMLTWRAGTGFVFDIDDFDMGEVEPLRQFSYAGEGWGLTRDEARLIMSDGTDRLRFFDPETLQETGGVSVTLAGQPLRYLNELEFIDGAVYANIWQTPWIARIDPQHGAVTGMIDLRGLLPDALVRPGHTDVMNGVAWDSEGRRLFVTGKRWPRLYEITLVETGVLER